ncbi:hypothetical protein V8G54_025756 [Vigna mungo]|uniref:Bromo domain-containing protein n=1 Tax=Vigna mungo TaxID=3915 RepID=A0AAQ3RMK3_VIGMU
MENHQNHRGEAEPDRENNQNQNNNQVWGTWEELLLAFAVNRHGFKDWDTVAMEVQSRATRLLATARHCEQKFHDLSRRFADQCNDGLTPPQQDAEAAGDNSDHVPWLDELRKLRVAELRREVQRRNDSILSLQLEVKRLEEEKTKENDGKDDQKPDLAVPGEVRPENDKTGGEVEEVGPANSGPERTANADKMLPTTGDESDRENQSVNESNSTGSRFDKTGEGDAKLRIEPDPVQTGSKEVDPVARKGKPVGEESNNGSYDALAKVPTCESVPPSDERKVEQDDDSSELHDSVAHSGEGGTRESSEVQSSASLTRKRKTRRRKDVSGSDGRGGGTSTLPENEEVTMVKSEPLVGILELIKGHEHCSLIESRLESQLESDRYKDIVKQPLDMETIQLRIQKGQYFSCTSAFFRDLLLLFTNATVIFPHDSPESQAARQLHRLVTTEMKNHAQTQSDPIPRKSDSLPPNIPLAKPDSLLSKNKASGPILVCRKRSSMLAKPSSTTFGQKNDQPIFNDKKERAPSDSKPPTKPSSDTDEEEPPKAKEKPVTGVRSLRRSNKNLNNKKLSSNSTPKAGSSGNKPSESLKPEKSKAEGGADKKRSAAADFLKRIKRNTSVDAVKGGGAGGGGGGSSSSSKGGGVGAKEQKKMVNNVKGDKGKERASRHSVGGGSGSADKRNKNIENSSQSKRSVGRPPKKAAETNAGNSKRGRENSASAGKDKRPKKRSKK